MADPRTTLAALAKSNSELACALVDLMAAADDLADAYLHLTAEGREPGAPLSAIAPYVLALQAAAKAGGEVAPRRPRIYLLVSGVRACLACARDARTARAIVHLEGLPRTECYEMGTARAGGPEAGHVLYFRLNDAPAKVLVDALTDAIEQAEQRPEVPA